MDSSEKRRLANILRSLIGSAAELAPAQREPGFYDDDGVRYLHFGTPWIQGALRLDKPDEIEVEYVQQMMLWTLFKEEPKHICQLGLGAGTLTRFCHQHYPDSHVLAIEIDPQVIDFCREHFLLPEDNVNLSVRCADAMDFVRDPDHHGSLDILQVDLYDANAQGPTLGSDEFYQGCANVLKPDGIMTVNLFCDFPEHHEHLARIRKAFEAVAWLPEVHDSNIVAIAFRSAPVIEFEALKARAQLVTQTLGLPAQSWVDGLFEWMASA